MSLAHDRELLHALTDRYNRNLSYPVFAHKGTYPGRRFSGQRTDVPCQEANNDARWGEAAETSASKISTGYWML